MEGVNDCCRIRRAAVFATARLEANHILHTPDQQLQRPLMISPILDSNLIKFILSYHEAIPAMELCADSGSSR